MAETLTLRSEPPCGARQPCSPRRSGAFPSCHDCHAAEHLNRALSTLSVDYESIVNARDGLLFGYRAKPKSDVPALATAEALFDVAERHGRREEAARRIRSAIAGAVSRSTDPFLFLTLDARDLGQDDLLTAGGPLVAPRTVLEITHRSTLAGTTDARHKSMALRARGYRFAAGELEPSFAGIGDYALLEPSFVTLRPQHFRGTDQCSSRRRSVAAFISLCKDLGLLIVASGVSSRRELDLLGVLRCDLVHGPAVTTGLCEPGALAG